MSLSTSCSKAPAAATLALSATASALAVFQTASPTGPGPVTNTPNAAVLPFPGTSRMEKRPVTVVFQGEVQVPTAANGGTATAVNFALQLGYSVTPGSNTTLATATTPSVPAGVTRPFKYAVELYFNKDGGVIEGNISGQSGSTVLAKTAIPELTGLTVDTVTEGALAMVLAASAAVATSGASVILRDFYLEN